MTLNAEERKRQAEYEQNRNHFSRPTPEQLEIASLEEELNVTRNLNDQLEHIVDKQKYQLDQINGAIELYVKGERKEGVTLDTVINTMGWKR